MLVTLLLVCALLTFGQHLDVDDPCDVLSNHILNDHVNEVRTFLENFPTLCRVGIPPQLTHIAGMGRIEMTTVLIQYVDSGDEGITVRDRYIKEALLNVVAHGQTESMKHLVHLGCVVRVLSPYHPLQRQGVMEIFLAAVKYNRVDLAVFLMDLNIDTFDSLTRYWIVTSGKESTLMHSAMIELSTRYNVPLKIEYAVRGAALTADLETLRLFLNLPEADENVRKGALLQAASHGHIDAFELIVSLSPGISMALDTQQMYLEASLKYPEMISCLLNYLPRLSTDSLQQLVTTIMAPHNDNYDPSLSVILRYYPNIIGNSLYFAAASGNNELVSLLYPGATDDERGNALKVAASTGNTELLSKLLELTTIPHQYLVMYTRPGLQLAVRSGFTEIVAMLLKVTGITNEDIWQAYNVAVTEGVYSTTKQLLNHPATTLDQAYKHLTYSLERDNKREIYHLFLKSLIKQLIATNSINANVHGYDHQNTMLHESACRGDVEAVKFLLQAGADTTILNRFGMQWLEYAGSLNCWKSSGVELFEHFSPFFQN